LERTNRYFYHGTSRVHLNSIRRSGVDPSFESEESSYPNRDREPGKAMRYCTDRHLDLARLAAQNKSSHRDEVLGIDRDHPEDWLILRTKATSLLKRDFGLDFSYEDAGRAAGRILQSNPYLTPDEFIDNITYYGSISCYEPIPPDELEMCNGAIRSAAEIPGCQFSPLLPACRSTT
jgi:hypothetical protein